MDKKNELRPLTPTEKEALLGFLSHLIVVSRAIQWDGGVVNQNSLSTFGVEGTRERLTCLYDAAHNIPSLFGSQSVNVHLILRNIELALNSDSQALEYTPYVLTLARNMNFTLPPRKELVEAQLRFPFF